RIEFQKAFLFEAGEKLAREEWVAVGLVSDELSERLHLPRCAAKGVAQEVSDITDRERTENDLIDSRVGLADSLQGAHEWMGESDLVVTVGADEQKVPRVGMGHEIFDERQRRRVEPLKIVDENHERVLRPRKDAHETLEHRLKSKLRLQWGELRYGRLRTDDECELGDQLGQETPLTGDRFPNGLAPVADTVVVPIQDLANEPPESLGQGGIGNVSEAEVETAGDEDAPRQNDDLVQLVHHGRLADPGIAGDQHEPRPAVADYLLECPEQGTDLGFATVQLLGNQKTVRDVLLADRERVDASKSLPLDKTSLQVSFDTRGRLIAVLGSLGEQLHHDCRELRRCARDTSTRWHRLARQVAMDPFDGIRGGERERAGQHLIERDAGSVEVATRIDRAVHASGLFGRHVRQGTGDDFWRLGGLSLTR